LRRELDDGQTEGQGRYQDGEEGTKSAQTEPFRTFEDARTQGVA
jgi:hypothetical protein